MKLSFNILGFDVAHVRLDLNKQADTAEVIVREVEKRGAKMAGKMVDRFSTKWMQMWVNSK